MSNIRGGARAGAGRPRQRLTVDLEHAHMLRAIQRYRRATSGLRSLTANQVVEDLIVQAASELPLHVQVACGLREAPELVVPPPAQAEEQEQEQEQEQEER